MKKIIIFVICMVMIITICICFTACGSNNPLVGEWKSEKTNGIIKFYDDGSCDVSKNDFCDFNYVLYNTYKNGFILFSINDNAYNKYRYKIENSQLQIQDFDGNKWYTYIKQ